MGIRETDVEPETWSDSVRGKVSFRTIFRAAAHRGDFTLGVTDVGTGGGLGHHRHELAEIYFVLCVDGTPLEIDDKQHVVGAGTAAYIPGNSEHGIRNSGTGPLRFFHVFAVGSFEEIEDRFTGRR